MEKHNEQLLSLQKENEQLKKTNELYRTIFDHIDCALYALDKDDRIILYNHQMEEKEGMRRSDVLGKKESMIYGKEWCEQITGYLKQEKKPLIDNLWYYTQSEKNPFMAKNKESFYSISNLYPFLIDGEYEGSFIIGYDLKQLHQQSNNAKRLQNILFHQEKKNKGYSFDDIIGESQKMQEAKMIAGRIATKDCPVMIVGDTGTGKELFAQAIHNEFRPESPFIPINCAAVPENLLESIFFGTTKGAFTGAVNKSGLFEDAGNGTIFLDEIDSLPMQLQAKLLRALQEKKVRRVGSTEEIAVNCRVISATNQSVHKMEDKFRQDLIFRLAVANIFIPSLKDRTGDVRLLVDYFVSKYSTQYGIKKPILTEDLYSYLDRYEWPGNVRELEGVITSMLILMDHNKTELTPKDIPESHKVKILSHNKSKQTQFSENKTLREARVEFEKQFILNVLEKNQWNITHAAKELGILRQNLHAKLREYCIKRPYSE